MDDPVSGNQKDPGVDVGLLPDEARHPLTTAHAPVGASERAQSHVSDSWTLPIANRINEGATIISIPPRHAMSMHTANAFAQWIADEPDTGGEA